MRNVAAVSQIVSFLTELAGIILFFLGYPIWAIVGGIVSLIDSAIQVIWGGQNGFITEVATIIVGAIIAQFSGIPLLTCIGLCLCIVAVAFTVIGMIPMLLSVGLRKK